MFGSQKVIGSLPSEVCSVPRFICHGTKHEIATHANVTLTYNVDKLFHVCRVDMRESVRMKTSPRDSVRETVGLSEWKEESEILGLMEDHRATFRQNRCIT